ncbi:integrase [Xanthobacter sp. SG618]|uniref:tyrosine-type recombinase/integrase n=1 Tax=Xanthobacter sp. SG618 TaxID=2587121 RepID=UPI00145E01F4|nr:site-specific integrase [Xanthobacter sp. SG618]NMN56474.1 integrase [Xanthobacter sp. SG618]
MARALFRLSAREVQTLKKPGRHADGGGLYLTIDPTGTRKRWVFLYSLNKRQREAGLGPASEVSLAEARRKAEAMRAMLRDGRDPLESRKKAEAPTFGEVASDYINAHAASWRNPKHLDQWRMTLSVQKDSEGAWIDGGYCASLRDKPVSDIGTDEVLAILQPIWSTKAETAARVRGRIEMVLDAAKVRGLRTGDNPAQWRGHLSHLLPKRQKLQRGHHAAMPYKDVPAFIKKLRLVRGIGSYALEFTILTAARSGEVRGATWSEMDLERRLWTIPAGRMKGGRAHRVPLPDRTIEILKVMEQLRKEPEGLVFPGARKGSALSDMALAMTLQRNGGEGFTTHGFRSAFRDWAGDHTPFPREVIEAALAHAVGDATEAAYRRGDALEKRRDLMVLWADFLETQPRQPRAA